MPLQCRLIKLLGEVRGWDGSVAVIIMMPVELFTSCLVWHRYLCNNSLQSSSSHFRARKLQQIGQPSAIAITVGRTQRNAMEGEKLRKCSWQEVGGFFCARKLYNHATDMTAASGTFSIRATQGNVLEGENFRKCLWQGSWLVMKYRDDLIISREQRAPLPPTGPTHHSR